MLDRAKAQLHAMMDAALAAHPDRPRTDLTSLAATVQAPYAKEQRLLLGAVAATHHVMAVGTNRLSGGRYSKGIDVSLYGFGQDIDAARADFAAAMATVQRVMDTTAEPTGEDTGTFRSSILLGFRLALLDPAMTRHQVETAVRAKCDPEAGRPMRSTGSGAWTGYQTALGNTGPTADLQADAA
jgi:ribosomal protein S11